MLAEFIKQTTTTTGNGVLTLVPVAGRPTFADEFAIGEPAAFSVQDDTNGMFEACVGHLTSSTTMVIDRVVTTYAAGVATQINPTALTLLAGTKIVTCTPNAGSLVATPTNIPTISGAKRLIYPDGQAIGVGGHNSLTVVQDIVYYVPLTIKTPLPVDAVVFRLTGVQAGSTARGGVYTCRADGMPGNQLSQSSLISTATNSPPEIALPLPSAARFKPASHYIGITFTGGATGVTVNGPALTSMVEPLLGGLDSMLADVASLYEATSGGTLPATANAAGRRGVGETPLVSLRLA